VNKRWARASMHFGISFPFYVCIYFTEGLSSSTLPETLMAMRPHSCANDACTYHTLTTGSKERNKATIFWASSYQCTSTSLAQLFYVNQDVLVQSSRCYLKGESVSRKMLRAHASHERTLSLSNFSSFPLSLSISPPLSIAPSFPLTRARARSLSQSLHFCLSLSCSPYIPPSIFRAHSLSPFRSLSLSLSRSRFYFSPPRPFLSLACSLFRSRSLSLSPCDCKEAIGRLLTTRTTILHTQFFPLPLPPSIHLASACALSLPPQPYHPSPLTHILPSSRPLFL